MYLPQLFKQNQMPTYSPNFHLELVCSSFQEFLSEKTPALYQNINGQKQAYLFIAPTSIQLTDDKFKLNSKVILNFTDFDNSKKSKLRIISDNFETLNSFFINSGFISKKPENFIELAFENIISQKLTSFRLEKNLSWEQSQIQNLAYTNIYSPELDFQATPDSQPLEQVINKYLTHDKNLLPEDIQKLIK